MKISRTNLRNLISGIIKESQEKKPNATVVDYVKKYLGPEYLYLLLQPTFVSMMDIQKIKPINVDDHVRMFREEDIMDDIDPAMEIAKYSILMTDPEFLTFYADSPENIPLSDQIYLPGPSKTHGLGETQEEKRKALVAQRMKAMREFKRKQGQAISMFFEHILQTSEAVKKKREQEILKMYRDNPGQFYSNPKFRHLF
jgi:hypothetical protein